MHLGGGLRLLLRLGGGRRLSSRRRGGGLLLLRLGGGLLLLRLGGGLLLLRLGGVLLRRGGLLSRPSNISAAKAVYREFPTYKRNYAEIKFGLFS